MATEESFYARTFQRHAHPFSAWSRLLSAPLLLVPLWTRRWWFYVPVGAWFAVNPVITPPARDRSSFATRAILGEESWTRDPTSEPMVMALSGMASASLMVALVASYQHRKSGAGRWHRVVRGAHAVAVEVVGGPIHARDEPDSRAP